MIEEDFDTSLKVIVVGNGQVGKTSMITRFAKGIFTDSYKKTLAVDFLEKKMMVGKEEVTFLLWDTAGQEEYDAITRGYYKGAGACVFAFSTTDKASFDALEQWHEKVMDECGNIVCCLAQTKMDLIDEAVFTPEDVEAIAKKLKMKLFRTCTKDNLNITEMFTDLAKEYIRCGGEKGLGVSAVGNMRDHATNSTGVASSVQVPDEDAPKSGATVKKKDKDTFILGDSGPSTQRTGGKKGFNMKKMCEIL